MNQSYTMWKPWKLFVKLEKNIWQTRLKILKHSLSYLLASPLKYNMQMGKSLLLNAKTIANKIEQAEDLDKNKSLEDLIKETNAMVEFSTTLIEIARNPIPTHKKPEPHPWPSKKLKP